MASFVASSGGELFESDGQPGELRFVRAVVRSRSPSSDGRLARGDHLEAARRWLMGDVPRGKESPWRRERLGGPRIVDKPIEDFQEIGAALRRNP